MTGNAGPGGVLTWERLILSAGACWVMSAKVPMLDIVERAWSSIDAPGSSELPGILLVGGLPTFGGSLGSAGCAEFSMFAGCLEMLGSTGVLEGSTLIEAGVTDVCNGGVGIVALVIAGVVCNPGSIEGVGEGTIAVAGTRVLGGSRTYSLIHDPQAGSKL